MTLSRLANPAIMVSLLLLLGAFLLYPVGLTVIGGFESAQSGGTFTLHHVSTVFTTPRLRDGLVNAGLIATTTTGLCILLALPLALVAARFEFRGKGILSALVLVPLILPPFVGAIGVAHLLGRTGAVNTMLLDVGLIQESIDFIGRGGFWAVVVVEALHLYPIIYLNTTAALANLDPAMGEAAENLGASRWRRFRTVVLPLIRPGLFAGATIVFIWSFTELGTPLMFEYHQVTPVQIFNGIREMEGSAEPYALTVVMLVSAIMLYATGKLAFGGRGHAMYSKASIQSSTTRLGTVGSLAAAGLFGAIVFIAILPHIGVVLTSLSVEERWYGSILPESFTLKHYENALGHPLAMGSIQNSLIYAAAAVVLDIVIGIAIAHLIVRTKVRGRGLLDALAMLPLAVPGLVLAFGFVAMTLKWPFFGPMPDWLGAAGSSVLPGSWFDWLNDAPLAGAANVLGARPNPVPLLIIAYAVRRLPYVVRAAVAGLEQTSQELEEASLNLGASRLTTMRKVTLPLIAANLIAGGLLAFSFAMLEVSDSLILAQREEHFPITKAIYILFQRLGDGQYIASAMGVWGMALLTVTLVGASVLMGRKMGALFRV